MQTSFLRFAWADAIDALRTALRAFAWTTGILGVLLFVWALVNPSRPPLTVANVIATFIGALVYAVIPGTVAAAGAAIYRLVGAWAALPIVVFPVVLAGVFWLAQGALVAQAQDVTSALGTQFKETLSSADGVRVHSLELLVAVLFVAGIFSAMHPAVAFPLLQLLLLMGAVIGMALLVTCLITLPPLFFAFMRRARARHAVHLAANRAFSGA